MTTARTITFTLNGMPVTADIKPHNNLVELLQSQFGLTGARESCGQGLCGCCTVAVDGLPDEPWKALRRSMVRPSSG